MQKPEQGAGSRFPPVPVIIFPNWREMLNQASLSRPVISPLNSQPSTLNRLTAWRRRPFNPPARTPCEDAGATFLQPDWARHQPARSLLAAGFPRLEDHSG